MDSTPEEKGLSGRWYSISKGKEAESRPGVLRRWFMSRNHKVHPRQKRDDAPGEPALLYLASPSRVFSFISFSSFSFSSSSILVSFEVERGDPEPLIFHQYLEPHPSSLIAGFPCHSICFLTDSCVSPPLLSAGS